MSSVIVLLGESYQYRKQFDKIGSLGEGSIVLKVPITESRALRGGQGYYIYDQDTQKMYSYNLVKRKKFSDVGELLEFHTRGESVNQKRESPRVTTDLQGRLAYKAGETVADCNITICDISETGLRFTIENNVLINLDELEHAKVQMILDLEGKERIEKDNSLQAHQKKEQIEALQLIMDLDFKAVYESSGLHYYGCQFKNAKDSDSKAVLNFARNVQVKIRNIQLALKEAQK